MTTTTNSNRPSHRLFAVTKSGKSKFWQPVGALFQHHDGKGFNLSLDYLPLNNADLVLREITDLPQAAVEGGAP